MKQPAAQRYLLQAPLWSLALTLAFVAQAASPLVSDDFNGASVNSSLWTTVDPVGGGTFEIVGAGTGDAHLRITVPGGKNHDAWNPNEALRAMQTVPNADFEVEARFDSLPAVQYQFEGILVEDTAGIDLRFDVLQDGKPQLQAYVGRNIGSASPAQVSRTPIADVAIPSQGNAGTIYLRVKRQGDHWNFFTSPDGMAWTEAASFDLAIEVSQAGLFAGNYQAAGNPPEFPVEVDYFSNSAAPLTSEDGKVVNRLPSISVIAPAANAAFTAPANMTITVSASDPDGTISKVEFYSAKKLIGTADASPFSFTWSNVAAGSYSLTAKATDNSGGISTSTPVMVAVNPAAGGAPTYTGLAMWLKADAGLTMNGSTVSQWGDQSGQDRNASQAAAASQPALVTTDQGTPGLRFDGVNDFLTFNLPVNGLEGMTLFLVSNNRADKTGTGPNNAALFWNETASWGTIYLAPFQSRVNFRFGTKQTGNQPTFARPASIGTDYSVTVALKDGTTDALFVNGESVWSDAFRATPIAGCREVGNIARGYNDNTYFPGDILEVLIYTRALTDAERQAVEQYLQKKYLSNKLPAVAISSPAANATFTAPANITLTADASDSDGSISKVEFFSRGTAIGTATTSPYRVTWSNVAPGSYTLTAKATDNNGAFRVSSPVSVAVNSGTGAGPTYSGLALWLKADAGLTLNGSTVSAWADQSGQGRNATQTSAASQPALVTTEIGRPGLKFDGTNDFMTFDMGVNDLTGMTLILVSNSRQATGGGSSQAGNAAIFWNETVSWGTVYLSPYQEQINWRFGTTQVNNRQIYAWPSPVGTAYSILAAVKDGTTDSLFVNGELADSQGDKLEAIAGCRDVGNLGRGYNDNTYWAGDILEALVYTRALSDTERRAIELYLKEKYFGNLPPVVSINQPANNAAFSPGTSIALSAQATDSDGTISKVEFFAGSTLVGTATASPFTVNWSNAPAGTHSLTAKATDNTGASQTSAPVTVVVGVVTVQPVSDDFNNPALNTSVWTSVDPAGGGKFENVGAGTGDAHLRITVPGGRSHDAWNPNESLRLLQTVPDRDFEVLAKFDSLPAVQYQFEGILVEDAAGSALRFDVLQDGTPQLQAFVGRGIGSASPAQVSRAAIAEVPIPASGNAGTIYVRVKREGQQWAFSTSPDGNTWTQKASFAQAITVARVGVFAGNYKADGNPPVFAVDVDYFFNTAGPIASEDGASAAVALSVARTGAAAVISWPQSASGFKLQVTDTLSAPNWTDVADPPVVVGGNNTVTIAASGGAKFYRLKK
ncbi:MAG: hypothetical protein HY735_09800 [Verrucomicrobia bacterium]|nr:hypothetical protein [Verrucomicrobiota bacterium]